MAQNGMANGAAALAGDPAGGPAVIGAGVVINGSVTSAGDLQISGRVTGEVRGATVFVDEGGHVDGAIEAERLRVSGIVTGNVAVHDLAVEAGGRLGGEIGYDRLKVAAGAVVEGTLTHRSRAARPEEMPEDAAPAPTPLAAAPAAPVAAAVTGGGDFALKLMPRAETVNPRHVFVD